MSAADILLAQGRKRVIIEGVKPQVDSGRFAAKRVIGDRIDVEADIFADGHDQISAWLLYRREDASQWRETPMRPLVNDRWRGSFNAEQQGRYRYTIMAWVDAFGTWQRDLQKRVAAGQDVGLQFLIGARLIEEIIARVNRDNRERLQQWMQALSDDGDEESRLRVALNDDLATMMARYPDQERVVQFDRELPIAVDPERARFSAWYEMFPRSCGGSKGSRLKDCEPRLEYIAEMGFNILYLPPIHPIGQTHRKGRNNRPVAEPGDPGSPWAIGSSEGGHKAINPELGTLADFHAFLARAKDYGLEIALDIAFQCSPDHPYIKEHPQWFRWRPDGTVQYAENPPKKYEDIFPLDFETPDWRALWEELKSVFLFWIEQGVHIFRVDNPHTKPFRFWEWLISGIKQDHPDVLFLSEAFTRPKIMYQLAKLGFSQSYTYFTWRNNRRDLTEYFAELTQTEVRDFFRPSLWPNTPDILHEYLQTGGRPAFIIRFILAATLGANYGIYGPAFELYEHRPRERGSEEYLNSEKYQIREWDIDRPDSLRSLIARVNRIRQQSRALQADWRLKFHSTNNDQLIAYSKTTEDLDNIILVVVNLDPYHPQSGWLHLPSEEFGLSPQAPFQAHDLLTGARYTWQGAHHFIALNPYGQPAHILRMQT
ncbi:MAG TPA: alpha-1,4-glucan--maltose-1-phosphate maltosyltransferase [Gammaproteobacteria bacterium]|nr:alpha-1,4-glucan--maltose-1-phosphate maltosyltransferase [Gammaproteobacteria bacterium]